MLSFYVFVSFAFLVVLHTLDFMFIYFRKIQGDKTNKKYTFIFKILATLAVYLYDICRCQLGLYLHDNQFMNG